MSSIQFTGKPQNSWLVRFGRTNEEIISVVFPKGNDPHPTDEVQQPLSKLKRATCTSIRHQNL